MAVWCTNTSSLVSFLLMKLYPFLTLIHLTVPKTFVVMTFLSLLVGAAIGATADVLDRVAALTEAGADVLALTVEPHREEMAQTADGVMTIPDIHELLLPCLGVVPLQLFAYYVALMRGCDIDKPRNLAKSVTVE